MESKLRYWVIGLLLISLGFLIPMRYIVIAVIVDLLLFTMDLFEDKTPPPKVQER